MSQPSVGSNSRSKLNIQGIAFEGGGVCGFAHLGALMALVEHHPDNLKDVVYLAGSSVGSVLVTLLALKIPITMMKEFMHLFNMKDITDDKWYMLSDALRLISRYGWNSKHNIEIMLRTYLESITGVDYEEYTFADVYKKFGTFPIVTITNWNEGKTVYCNPKTTPDRKLLETVRISCSYPLEFEPEIDSHGIYYCDGGILDNFPIETLFQHCPPESVVGFKLVSGKKTSDGQWLLEHEVKAPPKDLSDYILGLMKMIRHQALEVHLSKEAKARTIFINTQDVSVLDFDLTPEQKEMLIDNGRQAVNAKLYNH